MPDSTAACHLSAARERRNRGGDERRHCDAKFMVFMYSVWLDETRSAVA